ncbi:MAG: SDR family oxidoreductase [Planctomycetales bacterium]|nr:SDR family oxidoreductase [Planctomycetales bacterium]
MSEQRRIVLTGASRGLGLAMTEAFIEQGHTVLGCARSASAIQQLTERFPAPHRFWQVDVADDEQVGAWAAEVLADGGAPDLLINNAALINANAPLWQVPPNEFSDLMDVNIKGVFYVLRHFVPAMIERQTGIIINFSSGWGRSVAREMGPYCASKYAIEGLTKTLAYELPRTMAAIPLTPGMVHTDMLDSCLGSSAVLHPDPKSWAARAVPFILSLTPKQSGESLQVPKK